MHRRGDKENQFPKHNNEATVEPKRENTVVEQVWWAQNWHRTKNMDIY